MKNNATEFLNAINENEEIRKYMESYVLPEGVAKEDALVEVAAHFGFELTKEELEEAARLRQEELKAAASDAEAAISELSLDQLDQVAGGGDRPDCSSSYENKENCWFSDGCDHIVNHYSEYECHHSVYTHNYCYSTDLDK